MGNGSLFTGTLNLLILQSLRAGPRHGYAIGRWIRETSDGVLDVEEGQLYPALHRLRKQGLLRSSGGTSETGRRVKFYELTARGRERLEAEEASWKQYARAVAAVIDRAGS